MTIQVGYNYARIGESNTPVAEIRDKEIVKTFRFELSERPPKYRVTHKYQPATPVLYEGNWLIGLIGYLLFNRENHGHICAWMLVD